MNKEIDNTDPINHHACCPKCGSAEFTLADGNMFGKPKLKCSKCNFIHYKTERISVIRALAVMHGHIL